MGDDKLKQKIEDVVRDLSKGYPTGGYGVKAIAAAGTPERITDQDEPIARIIIIALRTNTGYIYIGYDKFVSAANYGIELGLLDHIAIPIDNLNKIWIDSSVNAEGISYLVVI